MAGYLELLNEQWRVVRCNSSVYVFTQRDEMHFFAMSNKGEDDLLLIRQIQHMQDHLVQLFSPTIFSSASIELNKQFQKKRLRLVFQTIKKWFTTDQSYLLMTLRTIPMLKKRNIMEESAVLEVRIHLYIFLVPFLIRLVG